MTRKSAKVVKKALAKRDAAKTPRKAMPNPTEQLKLFSGGTRRARRATAFALVQPISRRCRGTRADVLSSDLADHYQPGGFQ